MLVVYLLIAIVFIVVSTTKFKLHPFLALIFAALGYGLLSGMEFSDIVASVNNGFGNIVGYIGIVIIIGCIIGTFLEESGGAYIMARSVIRFSGEKRVPLAMLILGYIISIPVYADSGFVILSPLNKALTKRAGLSLACTVIALSLGLTITHCLVPPTPGPISAAAILGADLEDAVERVKNAPSATKSFIPIIVPLLLIVLKSISDFPTAPFGDGVFFKMISFIGEPIIALLIGMLFAFLLPKKLEREMLSTTGWVGKSLNSAAVIIMITAAGGSFGMVLQDSGIADVLGTSLSHAKLGIWLPFIIAAALKTSQGSSTVAIVTTASLIAPLMGALGFVEPFEKALAVMAVCSGAMVVSHVNDSFFWVVTQMSGLDIRYGYKFHTLGTLVCGVTSMLAVWAMYLLFC